MATLTLDHKVEDGTCRACEGWLSYPRKCAREGCDGMLHGWGYECLYSGEDESHVATQRACDRCGEDFVDPDY